MDQPSSSVILTPFNYFEWKPKIELLLHSKGLYRVTMGTEVEPTSAIEKSNYFNRIDEAYGIVCLRISQDILFHVDTCKTPNDVWKKLKDFLGKKDNLRGHQLENDIHALNPRYFETLQDYFYKFKTFLSHVRACGIDKKDEHLIFLILTKLGPEYYIYTFSFHTTKLAMGSTWKIPSLYEFMESLIHVQTNLLQIGALNTSKPHELTTQGTSKKNKYKSKGKDQENNKQGKQNFIDETSSSKESKRNKEKTKCSYCNMGFHPNISCMKNTIDLMAQSLEQHHLEDFILENARKKPLVNPS
jgi:hypothetical protein